MKNMKKIIYSILILTGLISISIGYSTFSMQLSLDDLSASYIADKDIKITNVIINEGNSIIYSYSDNSISSKISLPNSDSKIIYDIEITNFGNVPLGLYNISNLPDNIEYETIGYTLKDKILENGQKISFQLLFKYKNNLYNNSITDFEINCVFNFKEYHNITYNNLLYNSYPSDIIDGDTLTIDISSITNDIEVTSPFGRVDYILNDGYLIIKNITSDITINNKDYIYDVNYASAGEISSCNGIDITSYGEGEFSVNGRLSGSNNCFVRLTDGLFSSPQRALLKNNRIIISKNQKYSLKVDIISGNSNVGEYINDNEFRVVLRDNEELAAIPTIGYDFKSGYYGTGIIPTDVEMISLYFSSSNITYQDYRFKISLTKETYEVEHYVAPYDPELTFKMFDDGLIEINGQKTSNKSYYIRLANNDIFIATTSNALYSNYYVEHPDYNIGDNIYFEYVAVANAPILDGNTELSFGYRTITGTDSVEVINETKISAKDGYDLSYPNIYRKNTILTSKACFKFMFLQGKQYTFDHYRFYLKSGKNE